MLKQNSKHNKDVRYLLFFIFVMLNLFWINNFLLYREYKVKKDSELCRNTKVYRDLKKDPIYIATHRFSKVHLESCDIPCYFTNQFDQETLWKVDGFLGEIQKKSCTYQKNIHLTQENLKLPEGYDMYVNTNPHADISIGYYNLEAYNFSQTPVKKNQEILASAFISNCDYFHHSPTPRIDILKGLMKFGVKIHSYGKCLNNVKDIISHESKITFKTEMEEINYKWLNKLKTISKYKFHLAFENSHVNFSQFISQE
jgi:hypothetical protein